VAILKYNLDTPGGGYCSGSLIKSSDGSRQYMASATHCLDAADRARLDAFSNNFYLRFNYFSVSCADKVAPGYSTIQAVSGTTLVFFDPASDVMLLELANPVPAEWDVKRLDFEVLAVSLELGLPEPPESTTQLQSSHPLHTNPLC
jgi:hypothetical protein